jgi:hypothetical protein
MNNIQTKTLNFKFVNTVEKCFTLTLGEMVNLQKVNLPKSQPKLKMTKMLWLMFLASRHILAS